MAIAFAGKPFELREILLKDKPHPMLVASPKGTVPVAVLNDQLVIEESLELMLWALSNNDPQGWLQNLDDSLELIFRNDDEFKYWLDRYKYQVGYPEHSQEYYRAKAETFLAALENILTGSDFLIASQPRLADIAIFPFVRQFAFVDKAWFESSEYVQTKRWLDYWLDHRLFEAVMEKYQVWENGASPIFFPDTDR